MDTNILNKNPYSEPLKSSEKPLEKNATLSKNNFWKTSGGIITIVVIVFLVLAGVAVGSYNLALSTKKDENKEAKNDSTPTPTVTSTPTMTSIPSVTVTIPSVVTSSATPTPIAGRFTVTTTYGNETPGGIYDPKSVIKLGNEVIKTIQLDQSCEANRPVTVPVPVVNSDGTKVYYVDSTNPVNVREIDNKKAEKVFYTPAAPYKYVAGMAINSKNQLAYTLLQDRPFNCTTQNWNDTKPAFFVNSKVVAHPAEIYGNKVIYEAIANLGEAYFVTKYEFNGFGVGGGAASTILRKSSDGSSVKVFSGSGIIYSGKSYVIVTDGYGDMPAVGPENARNQNVFKIDLNTGAVTYIVTDTLIRDFKISNGKLVITYGGYLNASYEFEGETKTLEYQL